MKIEVLAVTMYATDFAKVEEMNLRNMDVVIANQTDHCGYEETFFSERNVHAVLVSTNTRGAGLNRNIALSYAKGDIILFADDDQRFVDDAAALVEQEFSRHPEADAIKFGCESTNPDKPLSYHSPASFRRASFHSLMSAGVVSLALRREQFLKFDVRFPASIGPGCHYYCGEDSCFLKDLLHSGLGVYLSPALIGYVDQGESSWFEGYDAHYFETVGYVYAKLYGRLAELFAMRRAIKWRNEPDIPYTAAEMYRIMKKGVRRYRK